MNIFWILLFPLVSLTMTVTAAVPREPTVQQVQEEAVRHMGVDEAEIKSWKVRARWAAALPQLQAGFQRSFKDAIRLNTRNSVSIRDGDVFVGPDLTDFDQNFDQGNSFEVKAVWSLNELIFNRDSLSVSSERRDWLRERNRVLQEVTEAYFTRKRMLLELKSKGDPVSVQERKKLLLDQATGTLDAHTRGWYSRQIAGGES